MIDYDDEDEYVEPLDAGWRRSAACRTVLEDKPYLLGAWDGPNEDGVRHAYSDNAKEICEEECPVARLCLASALNNPRAQGLRAGYEFDGGRVPVAKAREIQNELGLKVGPHQSLGRAKQ